MTFDIKDLCFIDAETRRLPDASIGDVTTCGAYRYSQQAFPTVWGWGAGTAPIEVVALDDGFDEFLTWDVDAPDWLKRFYERAEAGKAWFAAWNMAFDRLIWNGPQSDFPPLRPDMTIDVMAQAMASGLPGKLQHAAAWLGATEKLAAGAHLIKLFEPPNGSTPQSRPDDWAMFKEYGGVDVDALRDVYLMTRPLPREDWECYWASEEVNDRGFGLDTAFCDAASKIVDFNAARMNKRINELTGGEVPRVTMVARILSFVEPILRDEMPEAREALIDKKELLEEDGSVRRPEKLSLAREKLEKVLAHLETLKSFAPLGGALSLVYELLTLRHYGGSATPGKFAKASAAATVAGNRGPRLCGQYTFNGAPQTGRFSSRGVQIHNLTRSHVGTSKVPRENLLREEQIMNELMRIADDGQ